MSVNPYESAQPAPTNTPYQPAKRYEYRPAAGISAWASWWLLLGGIIEVTMAIPLFFFDPYLNEDPEALAAQWNVPMETVIAFFLGIVGVGCLMVTFNIVGIVLYCVWLFRANKNAHALVSSGMEYTPGWAVGWSFIPIANLFMPYRVVKEVFQASNPRPDSDVWKQSSVPGWILGWWLLWILNNMLGQAELRMSMRDDPSIVEAARWLGLGSAIVGLIAAIMVFLVIRTIQANQVAKYESATPNTASAPQVEGWNNFR